MIVNALNYPCFEFYVYQLLHCDVVGVYGKYCMKNETQNIDIYQGNRYRLLVSQDTVLHPEESLEFKITQLTQIQTM